MKLGRCIGRKDYDGAIRLLKGTLVTTDADVPNLILIAWCHRWSNRGDEALAFAERGRTYDAKNFEANRLLAEIYAERKQHETAVGFVRLGLENFPEPTPPVPDFVFTVFRALTFFLPKLRRVVDAAKTDLSRPNKETEDWYTWANQYLTWYEFEFGGKHVPTVH